jgi:hypothetical protein
LAGAASGAAAALVVFALQSLVAGGSAGPVLRRLVTPFGWSALAAAGGIACRRARQAVVGYLMALAYGMAATAIQLWLVGPKNDFDDLFWAFLVNYLAFGAVLGLVAWLPQRRRASAAAVVMSGLSAAVLGLFALPLVLYASIWYVGLSHGASVTVVVAAYGALMWGYLGYARTGPLDGAQGRSERGGAGDEATA